MSEGTVLWNFYGYRTPADGDPVQEWFDGLTDEEREELVDTIGYLKVLPRHHWGLPKFEAFDSEISEIRFTVNAPKRIFRLYGTFWPKTQRYVYTFLLGKQKKVNNDTQGKKLAIARLKKLLSGEEGAHGFRFDKKSDSKAAKGKS